MIYILYKFLVNEPFVYFGKLKTYVDSTDRYQTAQEMKSDLWSILTLNYLAR